MDYLADQSTDSRIIEIEGMMKLMIEDGQIQEERSYYDAEDHLTQLGITEE